MSHATMLVLLDEEYSEAEDVCDKFVGDSYDYYGTYKMVKAECGAWNNKGITLKEGSDTEEYYKFKYHGKEYCYRCFEEDADYDKLVDEVISGFICNSGCFFVVDFKDGEGAAAWDKARELFKAFLKRKAMPCDSVELVDVHI